jgi:thiosulfate reductase cytochrome b subunit
LSKETKPGEVVRYIRQTTFTNADALNKFGYIVGAHRIPALDIIVILTVLAPLGLPIAHGGLRLLTRRKHPIHLPEEKILLHPLTERIWHWLQAVCVVALIITGAMLHWPEKFPGWFDWAVTLHNWFGALMIGSFFLWLAYNLGTGRISHYFPKKGEMPRGMIIQARFYLVGIFKHDPHPYPPTEDNKFNPLQKITYMQKQLVLVPILLISGIVYMYPDFFKVFIDAIGGLKVVAIAHLLLAAIFASFLVAHIYLATTGETVGENFKTMISGYGIKSEHGGHTHV